MEKTLNLDLTTNQKVLLAMLNPTFYLFLTLIKRLFPSTEEKAKAVSDLIKKASDSGYIHVKIKIKDKKGLKLPAMIGEMMTNVGFSSDNSITVEAWKH